MTQQGDSSEAYRRLLAAYEEMAAVFELAERLSAHRDEDAVIGVLMDILRRLVPVTRSAVAWQEEDSFRILSIGDEDVEMCRVVKEASDDLHWVLQEERVIPVASPFDGARSILYIPLVSPGDVVGVIVIEVDTHAEDIRPHQQREMRLVAHHASVAIDNARLYQSYDDQNRALTKLSDAVERSRMELAIWSQELEKQVEERTGELRAAHAQLSQQHEELQEAHGQQDRVHARLREMDRLKSEFLGTISHELKTPLNAIIGYAEVLLDGIAGQITDEQQAHAKRIRESARHLLDLIVDLLDLTKIEAGKITLTPSTFDAQILLASAVAPVEALASQRSIEIRMEPVPEPCELEADEQKVGQILLNLVQNAVSYTPEGGRVTVSVRPVAPQDPWWDGLPFDPGELRKQEARHFCVVDTGLGIAEEDHDKIFRRFSRLHRGAGGSGLGLPISRQLVTLHGGAIWVVSPVSSDAQSPGSAFHFVLPRRVWDPDEELAID